MGVGYRKFHQGANIKPKSTSTNSAQGDLEVSSVTAKISYHDGTTNSPLVTESGTATLTNKTLTGNTATSLVNGAGTLNINSTGTVTIPNTTDTLVGKNTTDTLTNKTLDNTTTLTIKDANFTIQDDGDTTKQAKFQASGISTATTRTFTFPDANTTLVGTDATQTLTNKTLSGNTATNLVNGAGTFNFNSTGTITVPNATDTLVGKATTDTLTNKTLTGNTAVNLVSGAGTLTLNTTGTITIPNATDTLVGKATTDTLTNKTLTSPIITGAQISDFEEFTQIATPANPASGKDRLYFKSDNNLYSLTSAGVETQLSTTVLDASNELLNLSIATSVAANALTIALKTKAGVDPTTGSPVQVGFRNATAATGTYTVVSVTGALSLVVSSGSTLGTTSAGTHFLYVYLINNAGTAELAISQSVFDEGNRKTTTAEGGAGAADSNNVLYSTTARTNVPIRLIGRLTVNETTAGTWASNASTIALIPFQIQDIVASYTGATTSLTTGNPGAEATIISPTKVYDSHGAYNSSTGVFTCPIDGVYRVTHGYISGSAVAGSTNANVILRVNQAGSVSVTRILNEFTYQGATLTPVGFGSGVFNCASGDTLTATLQLENGIAAFSLAGGAQRNWGVFEKLDSNFGA